MTQSINDICCRTLLDAQLDALHIERIILPVGRRSFLCVTAIRIYQSTWSWSLINFLSFQVKLNAVGLLPISLLFFMNSNSKESTYSLMHNFCLPVHDGFQIVSSYK